MLLVNCIEESTSGSRGMNRVLVSQAQNQRVLRSPILRPVDFWDERLAKDASSDWHKTPVPGLR
jgi:hypothetical protein